MGRTGLVQRAPPEPGAASSPMARIREINKFDWIDTDDEMELAGLWGQIPGLEDKFAANKYWKDFMRSIGGGMNPDKVSGVTPLVKIWIIHDEVLVDSLDERQLEGLWAGYGKKFPRKAIAYWPTWETSIRKGLEPTEVKPIANLIRSLIGNPEAPADRAIAMIREVDVERLYDVPEFKSEPHIHLLAGSAPGREVLEEVAQKFEKSGDLGLAGPIRAEFDYRDNPAPASASSLGACALINDALRGEGAFQQMLYDDWLKLPVTAFDFGTVEDGGVYYDAGLGTPKAAAADKNAVGKTEGIEWAEDKDDGVPSRVPLIYIRVGPRATADLVEAKAALAVATGPSDIGTQEHAVAAGKALIRSAIYHEYQHLQDYRKRRDPDSSAEERALVDRPTSAETRAYAAQIRDYGHELTGPQISRLLQTLATTLPFSDSAVQSSAVHQIVQGLQSKGASDFLVIEELRTAKQLISALSAKEQAALTLLAAGIDARITELG